MGRQRHDHSNSTARCNGGLKAIDWIPAHPAAGDVIPNAEGARKVRWKRAGTGKSGGARLIDFNWVDDEVVSLVAVYAEAEARTGRATSPAQIAVRQARDATHLT